jgi:hypothetical protein
MMNHYITKRPSHPKFATKHFQYQIGAGRKIIITCYPLPLSEPAQSIGTQKKKAAHNKVPKDHTNDYRGGPNIGHGRTHVHPITVAKRSNFSRYKIMIRSEYKYPTLGVWVFDFA